MGARPWSLPADEIAVRCRDRAQAGSDGLSVGRKAHRAAGLAPFEAGLGEQLVQSFGDRFTLDCFRARHDPGPHTRSYLAPARDVRRRTQIAETAIGA